MRKFIPNVITPEDARTLINFMGNKSFLRKKGAEDPVDGGENWYEGPAVRKIRKAIESIITPDWAPPSYIRLEKRLVSTELPRGNEEWHVDTGSNDQTIWCDYGCIVLLTNDENSGFLEYRDGTKFLPEEHYCGMLIHGSDVEHRVGHGANRTTFLAFLVDKAKDSPNTIS